MGDAAHLVLSQNARRFTGHFLIDDTLLHEVGGVRDFEKYRVDPSMPLAPDFFVPADSIPPPGVTLARVGMLP
jgi:citronellol/citronellal dehydrogenase